MTRGISCDKVRPVRVCIGSFAVRYPSLSVVTAVLVLGLAPQAHAALGGKVASVDNDRAKFHAVLARSSDRTGAITTHQLTLGDSGVTREFTGSDGTVFAVSWNGPMRPNLRQLFGDYYPRFQAANAQTGHIRMRRALAANDPDFVVRSGGHPGAFWGYAILTTKIPAGFDASQLTRGAQ